MKKHEKLTKTDLQLIKKVMEKYAQEQWLLHQPNVNDKHAKAFNVASLISRYKLRNL